MVKWGAHGLRCDSPQTGDTWLFDPTTGLWEESQSPKSPHGMCGTWGKTYDTANQAVVSVQAAGATHGWQWDRGRAMRAASPWVYHSERDTWSPMQRVESTHGPGMRAFHYPAYHEQAQVNFFYGGQMGNNNSGDIADQGWVYDTYANRWVLLDPSDPLPGKRAHHGMSYLPNLNKIMMVSGSYFKADNLTWLFDLENNEWRDTEAEGDVPPRLPMVYEPVSETVLWFGPHVEEGTRIRQYDPAANRWIDIPAPDSPSPHHRSVDVTYDPNHNVFIMDGGLLSWDTGHIAVRETWTYKFKHGTPAEPGIKAPSAPTVTTRENGRVAVRWDPVPDAAGYRVYRGEGPEPWQLTFTPASAEAISATEFEETLTADAGIVHYRVAAVDANGAEGHRSRMTRTQPALVHDVVASVRADRTVHVEWEASAAEDVVGYHIYATTVEIGTMHPSRLFRKIRPLARVTDEPVPEATFADSRPLAESSELFSHEVRAYTVHAVNRHGLESGPSAMAVTLPAATPRARAREQGDGTTVVEWDPSPEKDIQGYRVYRMDEFPRSLAIPLNFDPVAETRYVDTPELPRSERRIYYVVTVNALGEEGAPSRPAHAFGRP